jgi:hypothetical protein
MQWNYPWICPINPGGDKGWKRNLGKMAQTTRASKHISNQWRNNIVLPPGHPCPQWVRHSNGKLRNQRVSQTARTLYHLQASRANLSNHDYEEKTYRIQISRVKPAQGPSIGNTSFDHPSLDWWTTWSRSLAATTVRSRTLAIVQMAHLHPSAAHLHPSASSPEEEERGQVACSSPRGEGKGEVEERVSGRVSINLYTHWCLSNPPPLTLTAGSLRCSSPVRPSSPRNSKLQLLRNNYSMFHLFYIYI